MPPLATPQPPAVIFRPFRADRRIVRTILADLHDGADSYYLDDIANWSLGRVVRFLAAVRGLTYIFVAQDHSGASYAYCGPDADSAVHLVHQALELPPTRARPPLPRPGSASPGSGGRGPIIRDAVERVVTGLHDRNDSAFVLASRVDGKPCVELDYSLQMSRAVAHRWVSWFLVERLRVATAPAALITTCHGS